MKVSEQPWAKGLKFGTHRLKKSWVDKRFDNLDEQGFPKRPTAVRLAEGLKDYTYHGEPGDLQTLTTWEHMVETGEMSRDALLEIREEPWLEYEVHGLLDFEGVGEAKELLVSAKKRRLEAGVDPMLTRQGPTERERKVRRQRVAQNMAEKEEKVQKNIDDMRALTQKGYSVRQAQLQLCVPKVAQKLLILLFRI